MSIEDWTPPREWEPRVGGRVVKWREPEVVGVVVRCDRYGHFADPYWRASVRWDTDRPEGSWVEHNIETTWLARAEQESQR